MKETPAGNLRGLRLLLTTALRVDPARAVGTLGVALLEGATRGLQAYWLKLLVDGAVGGDTGRILFAAAAYGVSVASLGIVNVARINWCIVLLEKTGLELDRLLIEVTTRIPTIEHHERTDYLDQMQLLRSQRAYVGGSIVVLMSGMLTAIQLAVAMALLASIIPALTVLPLFALPAVFLASRASRIHQASLEATAEPRRMADHLFTLSTSAAAAKELRLFDLGDELAQRHEAAWAAYESGLRRSARRSWFVSAIGSAAYSAGHVLALGYIVYAVVERSGSLTAGDVLLVLTATTTVNTLVGGIASQVTVLWDCLRTIARLVWLQSYADEVGSRMSARDGQAVPDALVRGIELDRVAFSYEGVDRPVLEEVTLALPAASTVAIVGENGAGKSTLVKLLCRFYEPTGGTITVDGVALHDFEVLEWRQRLSCGFQDFMRPELVARDAVGIGDLDHMDDPHVMAALDRAKASDVLAAMPDGLATQLGRSFSSGVELSVGQWQKVALGRTMMRTAPLVLLLDEPTASLDAQTEHDLFVEYANAARRARANGAITVLVSHRFSTVRTADLIVVLDGGKVDGVGTHDELMAANGLYAELYRISERSYR